MIHSFADKKTREFYEGKRVAKFQAFASQAEKRLTILEAAQSLEDLMLIKSNHFEALSGNRNGQYSIMINAKWRICFSWVEDPPGATNVEICDYH